MIKNITTPETICRCTSCTKREYPVTYPRRFIQCTGTVYVGVNEWECVSPKGCCWECSHASKEIVEDQGTFFSLRGCKSHKELSSCYQYHDSCCDDFERGNCNEELIYLAKQDEEERILELKQNDAKQKRLDQLRLLKDSFGFRE